MLGHKAVGGLVALALAMLLYGCTAYPGGARVLAYQGGDQPLFRGIAYPLPTQEHFAPPVRYIFHIHGMGLTKRDEFHDDLYSLLAQKYPDRQPNEAWYPAKLAQAVTIKAEGMDCKRWKDHLEEGNELGGVIEKPCYFDSFGTFRVDTFKSRDGKEVVRLYTYFWHRDLWRIQEPHLRQDMLRNHLWRPAVANTYLKHDLMDGGFSDAATYAGPAGDLARAGISSVLCTMALEAAGKGFHPEAAHSLRTCGDGLDTGPDVEFSYVSHSLGSRMLFDVLAPRAPLEDAAASAERGSARGLLIDRGRTIFMAANQLPLLALARIQLSGDPAGGPKSASASPATADAAAAGAAPVDPVVSLLQAKRRFEGYTDKRKPGPPPADSLQVIDFLDPDDILGFQASDTSKAQAEFIDVSHRNAAQFFWAVTWPGTAHDHELKRPETRQMILCGARIRANGRVVPYECRPPV